MMSSRPLVSYADADTGLEITNNQVILEDVTAGVPARKTLTITNEHYLPMQLTNPQPTTESLKIISYTTEVIEPKGQGEIVIEFLVPYDSPNLSAGWFTFDGKFGEGEIFAV